MKTSSYIAFYVMAAVIILNLNGMLFMLVGVLQLMTPILILCIGVLTLNLYPSFGKGLGDIGKLYVLVIFLYLFIGFFATIYNGHELKVNYIVTNTITVVTVMCIAAFTFEYLRVHRRSFINHIFYLVLIASSSIPFSPLLLHIYTNPPAEIARGFGFFANPNEGGILSVIGLGLLFAARLPTYLKVIFYMVLLTNTVMTFSKSSMLLFMLVSLGGFFTSELRVKMRYSVVIIAAFVVAAYAAPIFYENLDRVQKRRIDHIVAIVTEGEISAETTSSRSDLWAIGLEKINQHVLIGNGLGELHHMRGGLSALGVDQGVHNVFLMLWGEAGVIVFIGFVCFVVAYILNWLFLINVMPKPLLTVTLISFVCLFMDMMSAHNVLNLRMHNFFLGFSLGCFAFYTSQARASRNATRHNSYSSQVRSYQAAMQDKGLP